MEPQTYEFGPGEIVPHHLFHPTEELSEEDEKLVRERVIAYCMKRIAYTQQEAEDTADRVVARFRSYTED